MQHGSSRPSFTKFAVYGEYKRPYLQEEVISFISLCDIVGKKRQAVGHTTPFSSPKQKPCKAITETQLLHHSGIAVCCSSAASLSCLPSHSSTARQHSGFPLPRHEFTAPAAHALPASQELALGAGGVSWWHIQSPSFCVWQLRWNSSTAPALSLRHTEKRLHSFGQGEPCRPEHFQEEMKSTLTFCSCILQTMGQHHSPTHRSQGPQSLSNCTVLKRTHTYIQARTSRYSKHPAFS